MNNIILNVSGRNFEVQKDTLLKIPYFANMINDCDDQLNETIFVPRSDHLFKHVLAYIIDPLYPYPKKYELELKFYGIEYNQLYDCNKEIIDQLNNDLIKLEGKIRKLKQKIKILQDDNINIKQMECYGCGDDCAKKGENYCEDCLEYGYKCNKRGCDLERYGNCHYCYDHC